MAPEIFKMKYNEKCDIWSCGVIMYILLIGTPPFTGEDIKEIANKIMNYEISYCGEKWENISSKAVNLLKKLLMFDSEKRISAKAALNDEWFLECINAKKSNPTQLLECIENLKRFNVASAMQRATLCFMATRVLTKKQERKFKEAFTTLDQTHSGILSLHDLTMSYLKLYKGNEGLAIEEAKRTMENIDLNKNGTIDYNGMLS